MVDRYAMTEQWILIIDDIQQAKTRTWQTIERHLEQINGDTSFREHCPITVLVARVLWSAMAALGKVRRHDGKRRIVSDGREYPLD